MQFEFKTKPLDHQLAEFNFSRELTSRGLFWEQGCGKTKPNIDTAAYLYIEKQITGMVVIAPRTVHFNWATDEVPTHMPDAVLERTLQYNYRSAWNKTVKQKRAIAELLHHDGLSILYMSYDSVLTEIGKEALKTFLLKRKSLMVLDESHHIKVPGTRRTQRLRAFRKYAAFRRINTGTPAENSPFDFYSQICFLEGDAWAHLGIQTFEAFKTYFGIWTRDQSWYRAKDGKMALRDMPVLVEYKNLERLKEVVKTHGSRLTKEQVLDLPNKVYSARYFDLTTKQREVYDRLEDEHLLGVNEATAEEVDYSIVRMLRAAQVASGYYPTDDPENPDARKEKIIDDYNPRFEATEETIEGFTRQAIIWCRFTFDIKELMRRLGTKAVQFDGQVSFEDQELAKRRFKAGDVQFFVANPQMGAEGLSFINAKTVVYHNNTTRLTLRTQSEDRAHRVGQTDSVEYIDIIAKNTIDIKIAHTFKNKKELAQLILGDAQTPWLSWLDNKRGNLIECA